MILLKADHERRVEIAGVPGLVRRPVDIDQSRTGFKALRTLRIYRFDAHSTINGHAEEDEVFIVVLTGSVDMMINSGQCPDGERQFTLAAASDSHNDACAAYLPPHASYRLVPRFEADIAYVRATPTNGRAARIFTPTPLGSTVGVTELLDEPTYAERLRLRLVHMHARQTEITLAPIRQSEAMCEALVHLRTVPAASAATIMQTGAAPAILDSWDTFSVAPGDTPTLRIATDSSAVALITMAA
ncbi:MAG: hypothetical protein NVS1B6_02450 [Steroidobacteraceae bacterium]